MTYRLPDSLWSPDNSNRRLSLPGTCALHTWRHLPPPDVRRTATPCNRTLPPLHADHGPMDTTALERPRAHRAPECIHISLPHAGSHLGRATPRVRASTCHLLAVRSSMLTPLPSFLPPPPPPSIRCRDDSANPISSLHCTVSSVHADAVVTCQLLTCRQGHGPCVMQRQQAA